MPKIFGKEVPSIMLVGGALVAGVLAYNALFPVQQPVASSIGRAKTKSSGTLVDGYTKDDYSIHFASLSTPPRDTFQPLVVRKTGGNGTSASIPTTFTGGEANWNYTGMASVNGVSQGLLESKTTGDSEFVTKGQHWKTCTIGDINADMISLQGPGESSFVASVSSGEPTASADVNPNVGPVVVPPGMVGQIGGNDLSVSPMQGGNGGPGRRRGRNWGNNPYNQGNE